MSDQVTMGVIKPEYLQRASQMHDDMNLDFDTADQANAIARHPATPANRKKEMLGSAKDYTERAWNTGNQLLSMNTNAKPRTFTRLGEFHSAANARFN